MKLIDGKAISQQIKDEVRDTVAKLKSEGKDRALAVILVGSDPASTVYVGNKKKACEYTGIRSESYELPEETTQQELLELIDKLNNREDINGILVQLPLPGQIEEKAVIDAISPDKDVVAIGSGGNYAYSAAVALFENTDLDAETIVRKSLEIASNICVYTNNNISVEKL